MAPAAALAALGPGQAAAFERVAAAAGARVPRGPLRPVVLRGADAEDVLDALDRLPGSRTRLVLAGTLRQRVVALVPADLWEVGAWLAARIEALLGASVDDVDTASELWVALRLAGQA